MISLAIKKIGKKKVHLNILYKRNVIKSIKWYHFKKIINDFGSFQFRNIAITLSRLFAILLN